MQQALDIFESYCENWRLQVNVAKTKVMIFWKRKTAQDTKFILHGQTLDIIDTYSYLGIIFKYNGTFFETREKLVEQANKALNCIYKLVRNESIPIDLQLKMFDWLIC